MAKDRRNSNGLSRKWKLGRQEIADPVLPQGGDRSVTPVYYGYDAQVLADLPIGYWRLDEPSGLIFKDVSTAGKDAKIQGGVTLGVAGPTFDGATGALFNGTTSFATVPTYAPVSGGTAITLEGWVNHNGGAWDGVNAEIFLSMDGIGHYIAVNLGSAFYSLKISGVQRTGGTGAVLTTGWHHLVTTWTSGDSIRNYLDGVLKSTSAIFSGTLDVGADVNIGGFNSGTTFKFNGSCAKLAVYNYALPPTTVATHYALRSR